MQRPAIGAGARVISTVVYVAPDAAAQLDAVRAALEPAEAGASVWNGMLVARILGVDSASVRGTVVAALNVLREDRPLPRVWLC
jgi:urease accessory protein